MTPNLAGILAMMASQLCFVVNDATMKWVSQDVPMGQSIFLRGIVAAVLIGAVISLNGDIVHVRRLASVRGGARTLLDMLGSLCYLYAVMRVPIADLVGMMQVVPLAITAGAALLLGEAVGWRRWLATIVGFIGALLIVQPSGSGTLSAGLALALLSLLATVGRDLLTRGLPAGIPTLAISFTGAVGVGMAGLSGLLFETWHVPPPAALGLIVFAALFLIAANTWQIYAMRTGEIAVVGPFRYSVLIWAVLAGWWLWGELPHGWSWIGMAILAAAGIYTFLREQHLRAAMARR
jgi:drug/metabolite transporter (DMT)-like permease